MRLVEDEVSRAVEAAYSDAAREPAGRHPFPVGIEFARSLGYGEDLLASIPPAASEAFSGVSNVPVFAGIAPGARVLDLGCGAGLDSLVAARRAGPHGYVAGIDFSAAMVSRASAAAQAARALNVRFIRASARRIPVRDGWADVALVNGILNLNLERTAILGELARVVRRGGTVFGAELILTAQFTPEQRAGDSNWFA
jgi:SAM-dependent methyltransferase